MEIRLTKHIFGDLNIPDHLCSGVFGPRQLGGAGWTDREVHQAVAAPIDSAPLRELARARSKVVIVTDDNTRATPLHRLLPAVLGELESAGIRDDGIRLLIGLGTHRPMTAAEIEAKFGRRIAGRYRIDNHAWDDPAQLVSMGRCEGGFEVVINSGILAADLLISIGSIVPHATAGFSGGGKTIMPGVCGEKTLEDTHWLALDFAMAEILGALDNPVRQAINAVARKAGLAFIVNSVLFNGDRVFHLAAGDMESAHRRGVQACRQVYGVNVPGKCPIVIAEAFPTDIDLRQAIKAICSADIVCEDGGVVILPADCPEGVAPQFPDFARLGFANPDFLCEEVIRGRFDQKLLAYTLVAIGRIISKRLRAILVSQHIKEPEAADLGMHWAPDLTAAYEIAKSIAGQQARVMTLRSAGEILPILPDSN
ncbi:MAG: nickel-dependent lactate racemase [Deltaproteobacteria bacterium]|nr:nickel-dependent lactate racemase [Deltaproteobacteria bacterium]